MQISNEFGRNMKVLLDKFDLCGKIISVPCAGIAHPVERHLAKVEVASSSLVARSRKDLIRMDEVFLHSLSGSNPLPPPREARIQSEVR